MNIPKLVELVEKLRIKIIGEPELIQEKSVYEYPEQTIEVVIILKLLRAVQGVQAQTILCQAGLFTDTCSLYRCVADCAEEIIFLLEKYPKQSTHVKKFVKNFFEHTIENLASVETDTVSKKKIRSANVRFLSKGMQDEAISKLLEGNYKVFCGYIHANYAHIMQSYGGTNGFNLLGVPDENEKVVFKQIVKESYKNVINCSLPICLALKETAIGEELMKLMEEME